MLITQLNAFLATAIGGFIFTLIAGAIKKTYSWVNSIKKGEEFLVDELDIHPILIRLSSSNNKRNTKIYSIKLKLTLLGLGILLIISAIGLTFVSLSYLTNENLYQARVDLNKTHDSFIVKSGQAKNIPDNEKWEINFNSCSNPSVIESIPHLKADTKKSICAILAYEEKNGALPFHITKIIWVNIAFATMLLLSGISLLLMGCGAMIDVYINIKIAKYNKKEIEKSYQYLT